LKKSMFGAREVKHMAMAENIKPQKKATRGISRNSGLVIKPNAAITPRTMLELIKLRVAPHSISPV